MLRENFAGGGASLLDLSDSNQEKRDYALSGESPLVGLLDNPWYPPYVEDLSHYHNCMEVGICISGCGQIEIGRQTRDFMEGSIVVIGRGLRHSQQNADARTTHWRYVLVDEDVILREAPLRHRVELMQFINTARGQGLYFDGGDECLELRIVLHAMFEPHKRRQSRSNMELEAMTHLLMTLMARISNSVMSETSTQGEPRRLIEPALRYVSENYAQEIRVGQMAESCALSESYFRKAFARIMGMPPLEYVNRYRINRSINLLRATNESILSIAARTGFPSITTYNRNFQRYVGASPAEWRKNAHG